MNKYLSGLGVSTRFLLRHPGFRGAATKSLFRAIGFYLLVGLGKIPTIYLPLLDVYFELPRLYRGPAKVFYVFRENYEEIFGFIATHVKVGEVFVDVGANFGLYAVLAARLVGSDGRVVCYEPFPPMANLVKRNLDINNFQDRLLLREVALSDSAKVSELFVHPDPGRNSIGKLDEGEAGVKSVKISTTTLDLEDAAGVFGRKVDWIKIDAEGAEPFILKGGLQFLKKYQPTLIVEFNSLALGRLGWSVSQLSGMLREMNYNVFRWSENQLIPEPSAEEAGDFVLIHKSKLQRFENANSRI